MRLVRVWSLLFALALGGAVACDPFEPARTACNPGSSCGPGESCLWWNLGRDSGYFCAIECGAGGQAACPVGLACHEGGASGCATCDDLVSICE